MRGLSFLALRLYSQYLLPLPNLGAVPSLAIPRGLDAVLEKSPAMAHLVRG
jgi:hypothetical protein